MEFAVNNIKSEIETVESKIQELVNLISQESDSSIIALYNEELDELKRQKSELEETLQTMEMDNTSAGNDKDDSDSTTILNQNIVVLELRSGTGGDEAGLFASDLYNMYLRFAEKKGWKVNEIFMSRNEAGGIKTASCEIKGLNCYDFLKNESGVHRVQRVPVTESGGRIHTSTATIAILPQLRKFTIEIKPEDLKWEFFRAGGHGGQNVNKVSTAVRLTHIATNLVVECQEERSQGKNREKALAVLESKIYSLMLEQRVKKITDLRTNQVGTGDRSEKIRTYNYPQNRITDHRINKSWYGMEAVMLGNIDNILEDLQSELTA